MVEIIPPEASLGQLVGPHPNVTNMEEAQAISDGDYKCEDFAKIKPLETTFCLREGRVENEMASVANF